jgi:DNA mismatch repair ATPase MutS
LFTHFEREEHIENLRGKLQDELVRMHDILQQATSNSMVIVNEGFGSTTLNDALFLGREVLPQIIERDMLSVYVTFIDELSTLSRTTVSMVSTTVPENPTLRTYKIVRRPADGRAYAIAIAEKYALTYESLKRRIVR